MSEISIGKVTETTVELRGPKTAVVGWDILRAAATQADPELRTAYSHALTRATSIREGQIRASADAADRLVVKYGQDESNVWWVVWVETESGIPVGRRWRTMDLFARDEGGTLAHAWMARDEAESVADRIRRIGGGARVVAE